MQLPFTTDQFLDVFSLYNTGVWPAQIIIYILAIISVFSIINKKANSKITFYVLAILWLWMGIVYHIMFFSVINPASYFFGLLFIIQGVDFLFSSYHKNIYQFEFKWNVFGITGFFFIIFSLMLYPVINHLNSHIYPATPTFGLPCPTTIFTFGILLLLSNKIPVRLFIIPVIWAVIGFSAAIQLNILADIGLLISAIFFVILAYFKNKEAKYDHVLRSA